MQTDIVIIGSGISGLTAAAVLAKKGLRVTVIEKENRLGGALKRFHRKGVPFDVGFHYTGCLKEDQVLFKLWNYCEALQHIDILPFPSHGSDRLYIQGTDEPVDAFFSYENQKDTLKKRFPREKEGIESYFRSVKDICRKNPFYNLDLDLEEFLCGYRNSPSSVEKFIKSITSNPALQAVFACPSLLYGIQTNNVSIDIHAMVAHGYYLGAYAVTGGGQSIVDAFQKSCKHHGVDFITSETVKTIAFDDSGVSGIFTESEKHISCNQVIYTAHPANLIKMLDRKAFRPAYRKRILQLENTLSMSIVFGTISDTLDKLKWNNHIYLPAGPNPLDKKLNHFSKRPLMLTSTERECNCLQAKYKSVILLQPAPWDEVKEYALTTQRLRSTQYIEYKKKLCSNMIKKVKTHIGPDLGKIEPLAVGTPLTIRDELTAPEGCAYGAAHSLNQYTPDIRTRLPGLLLSGQSTLMTGVAGASLAGFVSAGHILGLGHIWQELKRCS